LQHVVLSVQCTCLYAVQVRYAWPSELDLMAQLVGPQLRQRWAGWTQEPFMTTSGSYVFGYARATFRFLP